MEFNGKKYKPFVSAFAGDDYTTTIGNNHRPSTIPRYNNKVTAIDQVMEVINDGDVISYPHYYRLGDKGLEFVISKLREHKKRGIILYANALLDHTDPWLTDAFKQGTLAGIYGNVYRKLGQYVTRGDFLPWRTVGFSHGNRVRKLQRGEVRIRVAFGPVPFADIFGNANGLMGKPEQLCGPLGLFAADALHADYVCLLAGTISQNLIMPAPISLEDVDFVVPMETPGLSAGIGSGTLDLEKIRSRPFNAKIADAVTRVMKAAGVVKENFNFQVGSGAGLIVLDNIRQMLKKQKIHANFAMGGCTSMHVDMLHEGTIKMLLHGQMFEPSPRVVESLLKDHNHHEITAGYYASLANKESAVNMLDVGILSTLEVDLDFNVNTVCANGRIIGGIGGGQDVAAGSDLTIMFLPLATGKDGKGFPRVVEKVYTRTSPGEIIDVVVTEEYVTLNPNSNSSCKDAILENFKQFNINLVSIEELRARSLKQAQGFGPIPPVAETTDEVVHIIEWRDGSLLDTIKKTMSR